MTGEHNEDPGENASSTKFCIVDECKRLEPVVLLIIGLFSFAYAQFVRATTKPIVEQVAYFDSTEEFPHLFPPAISALQPVPEGDKAPATSCTALTHIQIEVRNPGPGDLRNVRLLIKPTQEDMGLIEFSALNGGCPKLEKDGKNKEYILVRTSEDSTSASNLDKYRKFGVRISIPKAKWKLAGDQIFLRIGEADESPSSDYNGNDAWKTRSLIFLNYLYPAVFIATGLGYVWRRLRDSQALEKHKVDFEKLRAPEIEHLATVDATDALNLTRNTGVPTEELVEAIGHKRSQAITDSAQAKQAQHTTSRSDTRGGKGGSNPKA